MSWLYVPTHYREAKADDYNVLSICSGGGGLDDGIRLAIPTARTVCYVEREAAAVQTLVARMEAGSLDAAPVWSDARTFDGLPWRGRIHLLAGGTPCQDLSLAGRGAGLTGLRSGLFWKFMRIARAVQPEAILWENVGGAATRAIPSVVRAFARRGYKRGAWCRLRASDVGATHERARIFVLAYRDGAREPQQERGVAHERRWLGHGGGSVGDVSLPPWPPGPGDVRAWGGILASCPDLAPATPQPRLRGMAHGLAMAEGRTPLPGGRIDLLRMLGNGVVPEQAEAAINLLANHLMQH